MKLGVSLTVTVVSPTWPPAYVSVIVLAFRCVDRGVAWTTSMSPKTTSVTGIVFVALRRVDWPVTVPTKIRSAACEASDSETLSCAAWAAPAPNARNATSIHMWRLMTHPNSGTKRPATGALLRDGEERRSSVSARAADRSSCVYLRAEKQGSCERFLRLPLLYSRSGSIRAGRRRLRSRAAAAGGGAGDDQERSSMTRGGWARCCSRRDGEHRPRTRR